MTAIALIEKLKENDQDHEFYPTTNEIIRALTRDIKTYSPNSYHYRDLKSLLDIGAGNGKVLMAARDADVGISELYAIEKSQILCQQLDSSVLIVGTEFFEQSLLSKHVDVIFCNPPYSQFVEWAERIIRQSASKLVYLVIPQRWASSVQIKDAIKFRDAEVKTISSFDFEDAEDRKARAKVDLIRIVLRHGKEECDDAFERFFKEQFAHLIDKFKTIPEPKKEGEEDEPVKGGRNRPYHKLVVGHNYPEALVSLYNEEMANIEKNYRSVGDLDVDLMREFEISPTRIMACLKSRLSGLKSEYWSELFSHLSTVTDRLTSSSRRLLLETLQKHVHVDFTVPNIYAVVLWVIKNANRYIDSQLIGAYEKMVDKCNVHLYKSNQKTWRDEKWRYCSRDDTDKPSHYALDYRIVTHRVGGVSDTSYSFEKGLRDTGGEFLGDLLTIAKNLGFHCDTQPNDLTRHFRSEWKSGELHSFDFRRNEKGGVLFDVRGFKNGNMHLRLNQKFILALNVEHGRLKGWLNSPQEAAEELNEPEAASFFNSNLRLADGNPTLLLK